MRIGFSISLVLVFLSQFCLACGEPQLTDKELTPRTFIYDKGWTIPGLTDATIVRKYRDATGSDVTVYKPAPNVQVELQGFGMSPDGKSLHFVPGYQQLVESIWEYRVAGRIYAYGVTTVSIGMADPPMWQKALAPVVHDPYAQYAGVLGCGWTELRYFDADGDGKFESLEYVGFGGPGRNSTHCATTPEWALKLLPNKAAAESCAKGLEPPAALKDILTAPPIIPVLIPESGSPLRKISKNSLRR